MSVILRRALFEHNNYHPTACTPPGAPFPLRVGLAPVFATRRLLSCLAPYALENDGVLTSSDAAAATPSPFFQCVTDDQRNAAALTMRSASDCPADPDLPSNWPRLQDDDVTVKFIRPVCGISSLHLTDARTLLLLTRFAPATTCFVRRLRLSSRVDARLESECGSAEELARRIAAALHSMPFLASLAVTTHDSRVLLAYQDAFARYDRLAEAARSAPQWGLKPPEPPARVTPGDLFVLRAVADFLRGASSHAAATPNATESVDAHRGLASLAISDSGVAGIDDARFFVDVISGAMRKGTLDAVLLDVACAESFFDALGERVAASDAAGSTGLCREHFRRLRCFCVDKREGGAGQAAAFPQEDKTRLAAARTALADVFFGPDSGKRWIGACAAVRLPHALACPELVSLCGRAAVRSRLRVALPSDEPTTAPLLLLRAFAARAPTLFPHLESLSICSSSYRGGASASLTVQQLREQMQSPEHQRFAAMFGAEDPPRKQLGDFADAILSGRDCFWASSLRSLELDVSRRGGGAAWLLSDKDPQLQLPSDRLEDDAAAQQQQQPDQRSGRSGGILFAQLLPSFRSLQFLVLRNSGPVAVTLEHVETALASAVASLPELRMVSLLGLHCGDRLLCALAASCRWIESIAVMPDTDGAVILRGGLTAPRVAVSDEGLLALVQHKRRLRRLVVTNNADGDITARSLEPLIALAGDKLEVLRLCECSHGDRALGAEVFEAIAEHAAGMRVLELPQCLRRIQQEPSSSGPMNHALLARYNAAVALVAARCRMLRFFAVPLIISHHRTEFSTVTRETRAVLSKEAQELRRRGEATVAKNMVAIYKSYQREMRAQLN